jgi:serine/threonine-protein kinase
MTARFISVLIACAIQLAAFTESYAQSRGAFESIQELRHSTSPDGKSDQTYIEQASRKKASGDFAGAIADYAAAIAIEPKSIAHYYRAWLYNRSGRFKEAIVDLDIVITQQPNSVAAYLERGAAHARLGETKQAVADYNKAIELAPNSTAGDLTRARAYAAMGDYAQAAARFDAARRRGPRDDKALNGFAWFRATCPNSSFRNGPEAVNAATKACEVTKWKDGHLIDTLAAAYAETGDFQQAMKYEAQAIASRPVSAPDTLSEMRQHLRAYQAHKPVRDEPKLRTAH